MYKDQPVEAVCCISYEHGGNWLASHMSHGWQFAGILRVDASLSSRRAARCAGGLAGLLPACRRWGCSGSFVCKAIRLEFTAITVLGSCVTSPVWV
jgi:hypothetical protein